MKKSIYMSVALGAAAMLSGCQAHMDTPDLEIPEAGLQPNTTLLELKSTFEGVTEKIGTKENGEHYIVHGRVISSDASGNIYKSLVIQDETAALPFSLNQSNMYIDNRLGQDVVIDLTGFYIGYYSGLQQIGELDEPYNGEDQVGFLAYDYWKAYAEFNGLPNPNFKYVTLDEEYPENQYYCITINKISDLNGLPLPQISSQLVQLRNVAFQDAGQEIYAPYQESVNRVLVDSEGQTIIVRNSGYSNFYNTVLPEGRGNVTGILSYYNGAYQLLIRDLNDVQISTQGTTKEDPFTMEEVLDAEYQGRTGWVGGYIVGSVKAGASGTLTSDDIIFGADAEMDNNLIIAESADETDISKCVYVALPQNSIMRDLCNLADHPEYYKHKILVDGTIGIYMGMISMGDINGTVASFDLEGLQIGDGGVTPSPSGSGTEADPYNIGYVKASTGTLSDVWVEGYVAGYVNGMEYDSETAVFSNEEGSDSYYLNATNVILSEKAPLACGMLNSVPAQLTSTTRPTLGLSRNPSIYGKRVKIRCNITDYLGARGIRQIKEVVVL